MRPYLLILLMTSNFLFALDVKLYVHSINALKVSESSGDELYFGVSEYQSDGNASYFQKPNFPQSWDSNNLDEVKNYLLWSKTIPDNKTYEISMHLTERDIPIWNVDDHVGTLTIKLKPENNSLKSFWKVINYGQPQPAFTSQTNAGSKEMFLANFESDDSYYKVAMILEVSE